MHFRRVWMVALGFAIATATSVPVTAMPRAQTTEARYSALPVQEVQHKRHFDNRHGHWKQTNRHGWYNGHRGTRDHRRGYKRHSDGWWYPLAAFGAGAVLGGALSNQQPAARRPDARHVHWCSSRYRTYRASDNTYVPSAGRRAVCRSPYN
jgi:hypothetical protein